MVLSSRALGTKVVMLRNCTTSETNSCSPTISNNSESLSHDNRNRRRRRKLQRQRKKKQIREKDKDKNQENKKKQNPEETTYMLFSLQLERLSLRDSFV